MARRHGISISVLTLALLCVFAFGEPLMAYQSSRRSTGREAYEAAKARDRNLQNRTMVMQHAGDADKKTLSDEQLKTLIAQMKEDFRRLQIVNNSMMRVVAESEVLDYKSVMGSTDEINKCAKRLQALLSTPATESDKKDETKQDAYDPKLVKNALFKLDELIMSFVTSPLFKNLVDVENADKARRDLAAIIDLSGTIKKHAEKLSKTAAKS